MKKILILSLSIIFNCSVFAKEQNVIELFEAQYSGLQNRTCGEFLITHAVDRAKLFETISSDTDADEEKEKNKKIALNASILLMYTESLPTEEKKEGKSLGRYMATKDSYMLDKIFKKCMSIPNSWLESKAIPSSILNELQKVSYNLIDRIYLENNRK